MGERTAESGYSKITTRTAVAAFQLAVIQLIECAGLADIELTDLSVNMDGRSLRIDIARLNDDGRLSEWLRGYSIDPRDLRTFGRPVSLPTQGPVQ